LRPAAEFVSVGRVVKPQGRHGEVVVEPLSDRPGRFPGLRRVWVGAAGGDAREMSVVSCWPHKGRFVLKLEGVETIEQGESLRGLDVGIGVEELAPLPEGSYYHHQLLGSEVEREDGMPIGRVERLIETGGVPVLGIEGPGGETLLPLAADFVRRVDLERRRLVVALPEFEEAAAGPAAGVRGR
jgi:16S rRNA processing protein RimM